MAAKNLQSLFLNPSFALPYLEKEDSKSFLYHFENKMEEYIGHLNSITPSSISSFDKKYFINKVEALANGLKEVLRIYLDGYPSRSYDRFKDLIEKADVEIELINFRTIQLDTNHLFYRSKKEHNFTKPPFAGKPNGFIGVVKRIDMFHVPFQKRKAIGTNRFSIPGFPCIYLSDALYTSWSECLSGVSEAFHAISYSNHRPLYMADLAPLNFTFPKKHSTTIVNSIYKSSDLRKMYIDYAIVYPLIAACHSKIKYIPSYDGEIQFKSEYSIPQLLLQWYREKKLMVDGIRYLSCTAEMRFPKKSFSKFNYVIPVIESGEAGFCNCLRNNFSTSPVYSYLNETKGSSSEALISQITKELVRQKYNPL